MVISAAKFKATCLKLMDRVATTGETIVITKHGRPLARLVGARADDKPRRGYGSMKDTILFSAPDDDLFSTRDRWNAEKP